MARIEDKILFGEIRKGNKKVFEALFSEYYESLVGFASTYIFDQQVAEDLVQELFVFLWEKAHKVEINTSIKAYFYQAIRNSCLNHLKKIKVQDKKNLLYIEALINSEDDIQYFDPDIINKINESINELPEQMAKVFRLKMIEGLKRDEIAEELDISVNTVKTQLHRARIQLRKSLLNKTSLMFIL